MTQVPRRTPRRPRPVSRMLTLRLLLVWRRLIRERLAPREVAQAVGIGVFIGCSPAVGFHGGLAVGAATLFRVNRLYCLLGSRVSNFLMLPWIVLAEIQIAHRLRTGTYVPLQLDSVVTRARELLLDWCLGFLLVGGPLALVAGLIAWEVARRRLRRMPSKV